MDVFEALLADDACSRTAGAGSGSRSRPIRSARVPLCDWAVDGGPGASPQADGPAGQGRLLGHRDQGRAGRRPARLSGLHAQGRDRRLLPRLRQDPARGGGRHLPGVRDPQCQHDCGGEGARRQDAVRIPAPARHGRGLYEEVAKLEKAIGDTADAGAHLCAGRQPQGAARLSRPPAARERRQFLLRQPHRRRACRPRRAGARSGCRPRGAPAQAQSEDPPAARSFRRRRAATAPGSTSATRWCASRCSSG